MTIGVAATLIVLGNVRVAVGEYGEAVDAFERAAGIRERAYGRDHASRMDHLHLLAIGLEELGS